MHHKILLAILLTLSLLLSSCGSSNNSTSTTLYEDKEVTLFSLEEKEFVHNLFLTQYLWYDDVPSTIDYSNFPTPESLVYRLSVNPPDMWSFTLTAQEYENYANQKTVGFGFGYTNELIIYLTRINAPAYGKLLRGDIILEVNGEIATSVSIASASENIGTDTTFKILRNSTEVDVVLTASEYTFKVTLGNIIEKNSNKIGYLRYDSFTESSVAEFENEFTKFKDENISELVIDLRYNGGGSVDATSALLDNIINTHTSQKQMYLDWNENYKNLNSNYYFEDADMQDGNELNMKRVIFLVTEHSASASEALINALIPYLGESNVVTIGDATHGKPVGMAGKTYGDNFYFLINFFVKNSANNTTGFNGIEVTCQAEDDLTHIMGDPKETMLKTALYYIDTDTCL